MGLPLENPARTPGARPRVTERREFGGFHIGRRRAADRHQPSGRHRLTILQGLRRWNGGIHCRGRPAVALVAVGSVEDEAKGELAKAYIVLKDDASATEKEIIEFCRNSLAAYKVPRQVQFVESVPTTSSGKIMRRMLRTLDES